jgi:radical S-adenosyl methionine domain-containing protein 2
MQSETSDPDSSLQMPTTVNYHLIQPCNFRCKFCFATFVDIKQDLLPKNASGLSEYESKLLIEKLAEFGFLKINFAGGEPTLVKHLPELVRFAASLGLETSIVTNGSKITREYLSLFDNQLDIIGLSIDSITPETNRNSGRSLGKTVPDAIYYEEKCEMIREAGIYLKINTVVHRFNQHEDLTDFILRSQAKRWKIFKLLKVNGQNDEHYDDLAITDKSFQQYLERHRNCHSVMIEEDNDLMRGSYIMIDPVGRFYDSTKEKYTYSRKILEYGVRNCLDEVSYSISKFISRKGTYSVKRK